APPRSSRGNLSSRSSTSSYSTACGDETMMLSGLHSAMRGSPGPSRLELARSSPGPAVSPLDIPEDSPACPPVPPFFEAAVFEEVASALGEPSGARDAGPPGEEQPASASGGEASSMEAIRARACTPRR
ncbi:unnamed protein product, partial [Prorocentrum cordatum]